MDRVATLNRGRRGVRTLITARATAALLSLSLGGCELPSEPPARAEERPSPVAVSLQASNAEAAKLYRVVERWFNDYLALNPLLASELGDPRFDDRFGDYASASWVADSLGIDQEALERLAAVDPEQLDEEDRRSYDAFRFQRERAVYGYRYPAELLPLSQVGNRAVEFAELASGRGVHPFRTTRDYDHFLARMDGFVDWTEQVVNNLRAGVSKGVLLPKVVVTRTVAQLEPYARLETPRESTFWWPLLQFPPGPSVEERRRLLAAYDEKLRTRVFPAYRRLHDYLANEYLPLARESISWSDLPSGDLWYAWLVRLHTTTELTPREVHEHALADVARLRTELGGLQAELGIGGDLRALLDAMRTDPKLGVTDASLVLRRLERLRESAEPELAKQFRLENPLPLATTFGHATSAESTGSMSYLPPSADGSRSATIRVDTARLLAQRSFFVEPEYAHALLGHHLQATAARRRTGNLPGFLRFGSEPAFVEGFAAHAESLGAALGWYTDPHTRFGALARRLERAASAVVDTGIHAERWPRPRAVEYLRANSALPEAAVQAEVDRIVAAPARVLAYNVGEAKFADLRRRAERQLGAGFDPREFHALVLEGGVLPLPMVEARVERWLDRAR